MNGFKFLDFYLKAKEQEELSRKLYNDEMLKINKDILSQTKQLNEENQKNQQKLTEVKNELKRFDDFKKAAESKMSKYESILNDFDSFKNNFEAIPEKLKEIITCGNNNKAALKKICSNQEVFLIEQEKKSNLNNALFFKLNKLNEDINKEINNIN